MNNAYLFLLFNPVYDIVNRHCICLLSHRYTLPNCLLFVLFHWPRIVSVCQSPVATLSRKTAMSSKGSFVVFAFASMRSRDCFISSLISGDIPVINLPKTSIHFIIRPFLSMLCLVHFSQGLRLSEYPPPNNGKVNIYDLCTAGVVPYFSIIVNRAKHARFYPSVNNTETNPSRCVRCD